MTIAIIGVGRIACLLEEDKLRYKPCTHIGAIHFFSKQKTKEKEKINCIGFADLKQENLDYIQQKYSFRNEVLYTLNYEEIIQIKPDVLVIATNTKSHYMILEEAIRQDISKIIVEKPVTIFSKEAKRLIKLSKNHNSQIWVNYERRYHYKYIQLKEDLIQKKYGNLLSIRGFFSSTLNHFYPNYSNEGILLHDTTHLLDIMIYLLGLPIQYKKISKEKDIHKIQLAFINNSMVSGEIITIKNSKFFHFELELIFDTGRLRIINGNSFFEKAQTSKVYTGFTDLSLPIEKEDKKNTVKNNAFIHLYKEVLFSKNNNNNLFKEACQNVIILNKCF